jgi:acetyl-CoA synthetase
MDEDGYLWFKSRKDDVIKSSGYRIGPGEIENSLGAHEAVAMAAVIGVPDERRGQVPKAFVVLKPGVEPSDELAEALRQHVRRRLAPHEVPREVVFIDDLPRTTTGKVMRERFATTDTGARGGEGRATSLPDRRPCTASPAAIPFRRPTHAARIAGPR